LIAGLSFTPSPVTPTIKPNLWLAFTMHSFCAGVVLAKTICFFLHQVYRILSPSSSPYS
jgi:capsular polysaccharide biosynthesis protein